MFHQTGSSSSFSTGITNIAGTSNSLLFYIKGTPNASTATLVNGNYVFDGSFNGILTNWSIISGGK